ncbi:MAG: tetratricopeptide repeat-containing sensor histidine kinase [Ignavibacteria bacterium]|nr:tetratricopeptide repeat-containing sensor histidine kinase [Ignavibacteria bacterium]
MNYNKNNIKELKSKLSIVKGIQKIDILNDLAYAIRKESPKECIKYADEALHLSIKFNLSEKEFIALNNMGLGNRYLSQYDKALEYHIKALEISEKQHNKKNIAVTLNYIGLVYEKKGDYVKSFDYHKRSLKIREELGDKNGIAACLSNIGIVFENRGESHNALESYFKALRINEELGDVDGMSTTKNNIGNVYLNLGNFEKAKEFHLASLDEAEQIGDEYQIAVSLNNIGLVYEKMEDYSKAIEYYDRSLQISQKLGIHNVIAANFFNIGVIYDVLGKYKKALEYCSKSLQYNEEVGNKYDIAFSKNIIGGIYRKLGNLDKALGFTDESLKLAKAGNMDEIVKSNYFTYSEIFFDKGDFKKSLEYYKLYSELKDVLFNKENRNKIAEMQVSYETEKKEKENELLKQKNEIQRLQIEKQQNLKELNATKDKFLSIIAHDLRSPFLSMMTFVNYLQDMESYDKENMDELLQGMEKTVNTSLGLLENLLEWAKTQTGQLEFNPKEFNLKNSVDQIIGLFYNIAFQKNIRLENKIDPEHIVYADDNMINTVVRNLVSNAVKFSFSGGVVSVSSKSKDKFIEISISDNGIGISQEHVKTIFNINRNFRAKGTADERGSGLGLILCKEFVVKNGGEIWVESEKDRGSTFRFTLPRSKEK